MLYHKEWQILVSLENEKHNDNYIVLFDINQYPGFWYAAFSASLIVMASNCPCGIGRR